MAEHLPRRALKGDCAVVDRHQPVHRPGHLLHGVRHQNNGGVVGEYQLFEETVYKDISFGPKNMGLDEKEIDRRVRSAAYFVGLRPPPWSGIPE